MLLKPNYTESAVNVNRLHCAPPIGERERERERWRDGERDGGRESGRERG